MLSFACAIVSSLKHYASNYACVVFCELNLREQPQLIVFVRVTNYNVRHIF